MKLATFDDNKKKKEKRNIDNNLIFDLDTSTQLLCVSMTNIAVLEAEDRRMKSYSVYCAAVPSPGVTK